MHCQSNIGSLNFNYSQIVTGNQLIFFEMSLHVSKCSIFFNFLGVLRLMLALLMFTVLLFVSILNQTGALVG